MNSRLRLLFLLAVSLLLGGCETLHYYGQAVGGHWRLLHSRVSIEDAINDPTTSPALLEKLQIVREARRFATTTLLLPENASYTQYAPMDRDAVTYNVVAAPEFSLQPRQWCFPLVGCVNYRGYFDPDNARKKADELSAEGHDVVITHAAAYSTLGWFADPLPGPVLQWETYRIVGLIFHELAHQKLYVKNDTAFNESYASAVAILGLHAWQESEGIAAMARINSRRRMHALLQPTTQALEALYASDLPDTEKRQRKAEILARARDDYAAHADELPGWESWVAGLNNARLISLSDYTGGIETFESLFAQCQQDWACFHDQSRSLGHNPDLRHTLF